MSANSGRTLFFNVYTCLPTVGLPAPADNGTTLNGMERDMGWVEGLSPREAAELQREAEGPAGGASDADAASHHWAVMRTVFSSVFWSQTY